MEIRSPLLRGVLGTIHATVPQSPTAWPSFVNQKKKKVISILYGKKHSFVRYKIIPSACVFPTSKALQPYEFAPRNMRGKNVTQSSFNAAFIDLRISVIYLGASGVRYWRCRPSRHKALPAATATTSWRRREANAGHTAPDSHAEAGHPPARPLPQAIAFLRYYKRYTASAECRPK